MKSETKAALLEKIETVLRDHNCKIGNSVIDTMSDGIYVFSSVITEGAVSFKAMKEIMQLNPQFTDIDVDVVDGKMYVNVTLDKDR